MLEKVAFTMYPVKDMARARAFYEETLGLGPSRNGADQPVGGVRPARRRLPRHHHGDAEEPSAKAGGTIAFEVEDLPALVADLKAKGVTFPPTTSKARSAGWRSASIPTAIRSSCTS